MNRLGRGGAFPDPPKRERLQQLDTEREALQKKEAALTTGEEAQRLADAKQRPPSPSERAEADRAGPDTAGMVARSLR